MIECRGCRACCQGPDRELVLEDGDGDWLLRTIDEDGRVCLASHHGTCVYLSPDGCGIYGERPRVCATFDCRQIADLPGVPLRVLIAAAERMLEP